MNKLKNYKSIFLIIVIVGVFYFGARAFFNDSPQIINNVENLNKIQNGMSREEVIQIMGEPQFQQSDSSEETLVYTSQVGMSGDYEIGISKKDNKVYRINKGQ